MSLKPGNAVVIDGGEIKLKNRICGEVGTFYPTGPSVQKHDTTANWSTRTSYIPKAGEIIVYTDYKIIEGTLVPNIKIGDGQSYLADLPFIVDDGAFGTAFHEELLHRDYSDQHPISAITGLQDALDDKADISDLSVINCGTSTEVI